MNKEVFKEIPFTHGKYSVSNKGSVRNNHIDSEVAQFEYHNGYLGVCLYVDGKHYNRRVHRLVAEAFIPCNNCSLPINHKDENKKNNSLDNLEWCTSEYNNNFGTRRKRISKALSKPVNQYDLNGNFIRTYGSITEASYVICNNIHGSSNISKVCKGQRNTYKGYKWKYSI